jgi:hypothetical protein
MGGDEQMNLKEIRERKDRLASDIIVLMERFKEDTGGFQITSIHVDTVNASQLGGKWAEFVPSTVEITVEEV